MARTYQFSNYRGGGPSSGSQRGGGMPVVGFFDPDSWPFKPGSMKPARVPSVARLARLSRLPRYFSPWGLATEVGLTILREYLPEQPAKVGLFPSGSYELVCRLAGGSGTELSDLYAGNVCFSGQHLLGGNPPDSLSEWVSWITPSTPPFPTGTLWEMWHRTGVATAAPEIVPAADPVPAVAIPFSPPAPKLRFWPRPRSRPLPQPFVEPPVPNFEPVPDFTAEVGPSPLSRPVVVRGFGRPTFRRPGSGVKERKWRAPGWVTGPVYAGTEAVDAIESVYDALPREYRRGWIPGKPVSAYDKLVQLYKHWDKIDVDKAVENLLKNAIEDALIGGVHSKIGGNPVTGHVPYVPGA